MTVFRKKNPESVPAGWRTCHVVLYAATGALGFAASVVYYLVVIRSHYRCYQYNEVQTVYERPGSAYTLHWTDRRVWYRNGNCYDAFAFPLALSVSSAAWTGVCLAFGRGGSGSSGREHDEFFRSVVGSPAASAPSEIPSLRGRSYVFFSIFFLFLFLLPPQLCCRPLARRPLGLSVQLGVLRVLARHGRPVYRRLSKVPGDRLATPGRQRLPRRIVSNRITINRSTSFTTTLIR